MEVEANPAVARFWGQILNGKGIDLLKGSPEQRAYVIECLLDSAVNGAEIDHKPVAYLKQHYPVAFRHRVEMAKAYPEVAKAIEIPASDATGFDKAKVRRAVAESVRDALFDLTQHHPTFGLDSVVASLVELAATLTQCVDDSELSRFEVFLERQTLYNELIHRKPTALA